MAAILATCSLMTLAALGGTLPVRASSEGVGSMAFPSLMPDLIAAEVMWLMLGTVLLAATDMGLLEALVATAVVVVAGGELLKAALDTVAAVELILDVEEVEAGLTDDWKYLFVSSIILLRSRVWKIP